MTLFSNLMVCLLFAHYLNVNPFIAFLLGILIYFLINLIPHFDLDEKNSFVSLFFVGLDLFLSLIILIGSLSVSIGDLRIVFPRGNELNIYFNTWFALIGNFLTYITFFTIEFFFLKDPFFLKIFNFKRSLQYIDLSIWGILIHFALPLLVLFVISGYLDIISFYRVLLGF